MRLVAWLAVALAGLAAAELGAAAPEGQMPHEDVKLKSK